MSRTQKLTVTVPENLIAAVKEQAIKEGRNVSNMVTVILRDAVKIKKEKAA